MALTHEQIASSVFVHWADQFPLTVATVYPGTQIDTNEVTEWLEIWINAWSRRPQRISNRQLLDVVVEVHCFVKRQQDKSRVHELVDAARNTLSQVTLPVRDFETSGSPIEGYAKLFEPEVHDLTRSEVGKLEHTMQHHVVRCRGIVQQT